MIHSRLHAQDAKPFFEHCFRVCVSSHPLKNARQIDAQGSEFFVQFRRRLRFVNRERFFHSCD